MRDIFQLIVKFNINARRHEPIKPQVVINEENMSRIARTMQTELTVIIRSAQEILDEVNQYLTERNEPSTGPNE